MYFVYILLCEDESLYTGVTNDVERRFSEHKNKKGGHYTKSHRVVKILYVELLASKSAALKREVQIKRLRREEKLNLVHTNDR